MYLKTRQATVQQHHGATKLFLYVKSPDHPPHQGPQRLGEGGTLGKGCAAAGDASRAGRGVSGLRFGAEAVGSTICIPGVGFWNVAERGLKSYKARVGAVEV